MNPKPSSRPLLTDLLREVSRSFYLTLRILPSSIRPQIGLAYLLARAADTIADTELVSVEKRLAALDEFRRRILLESTSLPELGPLREVAGQHRPAGQGSAAEKLLLERLEDAFGLIDGLSDDDQRRVRDVLDTITGGQILDLQRFGKANERQIASLESDEALDDYTYRVAGCVGEFWTKMCRAHLFPRDLLDETLLLTRGIRFGMGLQLVNILRDLPADLRMGRCYLPASGLQQLGLTPSMLLDAAREQAVWPLYEAWLDRAEGHLREGWAYTCSLPWRCFRVRLACAWPVLIGARTLSHLRRGSFLNPSHRIKVTRGEVRQILIQTIWRAPFPLLWKRLFRV